MLLTLAADGIGRHLLPGRRLLRRHQRSVRRAGQPAASSTTLPRPRRATSYAAAGPRADAWQPTCRYGACRTRSGSTSGSASPLALPGEAATRRCCWIGLATLGLCCFTGRRLSISRSGASGRSPINGAAGRARSPCARWPSRFPLALSMSGRAAGNPQRTAQARPICRSACVRLAARADEAPQLSGLGRHERFNQALSNFSYSLYVIHYPLLLCFVSLLHHVGPCRADQAGTAARC